MKMRSIYTFDIGATHTRAGIFQDGELTVTGSALTPHSAQHPPGDSSAIAELLNRLFTQIAADHDWPDAISVAVSGCLRVVDTDIERAGPLDRKDLVLSSPNIAGLNNIAFMDFLSSLGWDVPIHIENDANAALRSVTQHPTALSINMGTGIGGAVKRNNRIKHFGSSWSCYEIGHGLRAMFPDELTLQCSCGAVGCLEAVIGSRSLAMRYNVRPENADAATYSRMREDIITYLSPAIGDAAKASKSNLVLLSGGSAVGFSAGFDLAGALKERVAKTHPRAELQFELITTNETASLQGAALALLDNKVLPEPLNV